VIPLPCPSPVPQPPLAVSDGGRRTDTLSFSTPVTSNTDDRAEHALMDKLGQLLDQQGYTSHGTQVRKSLSSDDEHPQSAHADTSILMRLEPRSAAKTPG
jgi:hypothetical protein